MTTRSICTTLSQLLSRSLLAGNRNTETPALTVRKSATSRLRLVIALLALWVPCISWPQQSAIGRQPQIEIQYGYVAQHYTTSWSDPALPAGVTRGTPPPTEIPTDNAEVANESPPPNRTTAPEGISTPTDPAIKKQIRDFRKKRPDIPQYQDVINKKEKYNNHLMNIITTYNKVIPREKLFEEKFIIE